MSDVAADADLVLGLRLAALLSDQVAATLPRWERRQISALTYAARSLLLKAADTFADPVATSQMAEQDRLGPVASSLRRLGEDVLSKNWMMDQMYLLPHRRRLAGVRAQLDLLWFPAASLLIAAPTCRDMSALSLALSGALSWLDSSGHSVAKTVVSAGVQPRDLLLFMTLLADGQPVQRAAESVRLLSDGPVRPATPRPLLFHAR